MAINEPHELEEKPDEQCPHWVRQSMDCTAVHSRLGRTNFSGFVQIACYLSRFAVKVTKW